jgi:hypothetical protein
MLSSSRGLNMKGLELETNWKLPVALSYLFPLLHQRVGLDELIEIDNVGRMTPRLD